MNMKKGFALLLLVMASHAYSAPVWKKSGAVSYLCGGVGEAAFAHMESLKPSANAAILLTSGQRGAYLSGVTLTLSTANRSAPIIIGNAGPMCLFKMPPGRYDVQADHEGVVKTSRLDISGPVGSVHIRFAD